MQVKSSRSHPLQIAELEVPGGGSLGVTLCPGKCGPSLFGHMWQREVHCKGGLGRAGMVAALLLIETGDPPGAAIRKVRAVRPGAIETPAQERYVLAYRPREGAQ